MQKSKEILQGFYNLIFPDSEIEELAKKRLEICFECPIRTNNKCDKTKGGCGCYLNAKSRSSSSCPKNKW